MTKVFKTALFLAVFAIAAPMSAQFWSLPADTPNTDVPCATCKEPYTNQLTKGYSAPITRFTGRFLDSTPTREFQQPFRTGRAYNVEVRPDLNRVYMRVGSAVFSYNLETFFTRLQNREPLWSAANLGNVYAQPAEVFLRYDGMFYAESSGAWKTFSMDGQQRLGGFTSRGFDVDDEGYVYVAYSIFGWGIVKDGNGAMASQYQDPKPGFTPNLAIALKSSSGARYAVITGGAQGAVYDVSNRSRPTKKRTIDAAIRAYAKNSSGNRVLIADGIGVNVYDTDAFVSGGAPLFTLPGTYFSATTDGTNFYVGTGTGGTLNIAAIRPSGNGYSAEIYNTGKTVSTFTSIGYGAGHIVATGQFASGWDVAVFNVGSTLTELNLKNYFLDYYGRSRGPSYVTPEYINIMEATIYRHGGKNYLIVSAASLGDVYEIALGDSVDVASLGNVGTANPHSPGTGVYYGDPVQFIATTNSTSPVTFHWDFGDGLRHTGVTNQAITNVFKATTGAQNANVIVNARSISDGSVISSTSVPVKKPSGRFKILGTPYLFTQPNASSPAPIVLGDSFVDASDGTVQSHTDQWSVDGTQSAAQSVSVGPCGGHNLSFNAHYPEFDNGLTLGYTVRPFGAGISYAASGTQVTFTGDARVTADASVFTSAQAAALTWKWELVDAAGVLVAEGPTGTGTAVGSYTLPKAMFGSAARKVRLTLTSATPAAGGCAPFTSHVGETAELKGPDAQIVGGCSGGACSYEVTSPSGRDMAAEGWTYSWTVVGASASPSSSATTTFAPMFNTVGTYGVTIRLTVNNAVGTAVLDKQETISIAAPTCPQMSSQNVFATQSGCTGSSCTVNQAVSFVATTWGYQFSCSPHTFTWNFGDGSTGTGQSVSHTYSSPGPVTVTLTVQNAGQTFTDTLSLTIANSGPVEPPPGQCPQMTTSNVFLTHSAESCGGNNTACRKDEAIAFTATTWGYQFSCATHSFSWNFGDGGTATGLSTSHTYTGAGTWPVTLTVSNGSQTFQRSVNITTSGGGPVAGQCPAMTDSNMFLTVAGPSCQGNTCESRKPVTLLATPWNYQLSCGTHTFSWNFGDGTTGTGQTVEHTYATDGPHEVTLTVSNPQQTYSRKTIVTTNGGIPAGPAPTANFDVSIVSAGPPVLMKFTPLTTDNSTIKEWKWTFGDGGETKATVLADQYHPYSAVGKYTVTLTVTTNDGQVASATREITAGTPPAPRRRAASH